MIVQAPQCAQCAFPRAANCTHAAPDTATDECGLASISFASNTGKTVTSLLYWFATSRNWPPGAIAKLRGQRPSQVLTVRRSNSPCGSIAYTATLSSPRLET